MSDLMDVEGPIAEAHGTGGVVQDVSFKLPMSYDYQQPSFFVRSCYPIYYNMIEDLLKGADNAKPVKYISLTGTPGVGKSVFYIYFFQRWIQAYPDSTIVTASFNKERKLKRCILFDREHPLGLKCKDIPDIENALHLYDGPPTVEPEDNSMVCFTSPSKSWLESIVKHKSVQRSLHMPVWCLTELYTANESLKLNLTRDLIRSRFNLLGGCARYCLDLDVDNYAQHELTLRGKISAINSFQQIMQCIQNPSPTDGISHSIFQIIPLNNSQGFPIFYELDFCSKQVALMVEETIIDRSKQRRREMFDWLKGHGKCAALRGWLYEIAFSEFMSEGRDLQIREVGGSIDAVSNVVKIGKGKFKPSRTTNCESVDGSFFDNSKGILYLFQCTVGKDHKVKLMGLIEAIEDTTKTYSQVVNDAILVYVVPSEGLCSKQKIVFRYDQELQSHDNVSKIHGIGPYFCMKLNDLNVFSLGDLRALVDRQNDTPYRSFYDEYVRDIKLEKKHRNLVKISQFKYEFEDCD